MILDHVGLTVPDLDAATAFFGAALGARLATDLVTEPLAGPELETGLGLPAGAVVRRVRMLSLGDGARLELFEIAEVEQVAPPRLSDLGVQHIAVSVAEINDTLRRVTAAGGRALAEPAPVPGDAASLWVYCTLPWGGLMELVQRGG